MFVKSDSVERKKVRQPAPGPENAGVSYPSRVIVHPKLEMTEPGDSDEREADSAADEVMSGRIRRQAVSGGSAGGMAVPSRVAGRLASLQGDGQPLPDGLRGMMERGFSRDFSQVRLHTDGEAAGLSGSIHARAFTHGSDIYFNRGQFSPDTAEGQRLVAHELAHVVQGGGKVGRFSIPLDKDEAKAQKDLMLNIRDYLDSDQGISRDGDEGVSLVNQMYLLDEPYFYQLLCTRIQAFSKFLRLYPTTFEDLVERHIDSFITLAQDSPRLYLALVNGNDKQWADIVNTLFFQAKRKEALQLYSRAIHKISDKDFHENGLDDGYALTDDRYHENRMKMLDENSYFMGGSVFLTPILPNLLNLNTKDFLAFVRQHDELYDSLGDTKYIDGVAGLWEHHVSAFKTLLESDPDYFFLLFRDESLENLGPRTAKVYQAYLDKIERMNNKSRWKSHAQNATSSQLDALETLGLILNLDCVISASKSHAVMRTFKKVLTTLQQELAKYIKDSASEATKKSMIFSWAGIALSVNDLYDTCKKLDFDNSPVASSSVLVLKLCGLASSIATEPHFFKFIAIRWPKFAAGLMFLAAGYAAGDLINTTSAKIFGETPGEMIVDLFT